MLDVPELFASLVFDDRTMKKVLSAKVYSALRATIDEGKDLEIETANAVAEAMKNWATANGATHFTHWFQPLTGFTAEKHDSFITPSPDGGVMMEFSGRELIKGEPDASSFPSGGLRATFEARGYTAWDPTSPAFIKDRTLCIPTAFCSYRGEALDKKTPLLRSMEAISASSVRILRLFGNMEVKSVRTSVGPEQEYFLIDKSLYLKRRDLICTGRTLFGAPSPKGQEMDDHYFGSIKPRVMEFMEDLNEELWKHGILAKTEHNEVAPSQHEMAPIYTTTNIAADHNQLTMELMQKVADRHALVCLLHEKPFKGVNGSGKHNNWSLQTDTGVNLLSPGETPYENAQFLLFLTAVIRAVDEYQDLLRISVASASNDHRLGANEAPPAIVSVFLGDELEGIIESIENGELYSGTQKKTMKLGAAVLPKFLRDTTDRNRTSPFAFTGNKFEFRMLGSASSISDVNTYLNSAVAVVLGEFAETLEKSKDFEKDVHTLIRETIRSHRRIIFNGNGYEEAWVREAERRGLGNYRTTPDAVVHLMDGKNVELLTKEHIFSETEILSRTEATLENYAKTVMIEANTMLDMVERDYLPAISAFTASLLSTLEKKTFFSIDTSYERNTVSRLSLLSEKASAAADDLGELEAEEKTMESEKDKAFFVRDSIIPKMEELRSLIDEAETITSRSYWPVPTYGDLLFSVR